MNFFRRFCPLSCLLFALATLLAPQVFASTISGTVHYDGPGAGNLVVKAFYINGPWVEYDHAPQVGTVYQQPWQPVDNQQSFSIYGLEPGDYNVLAFLDIDGSGDRSPGEPLGVFGGIGLFGMDFTQADLGMEVPVIAFQPGQKVFPMRRADLGGDVYLTFNCSIPDAGSVQVTGPGLAAPVDLLLMSFGPAGWSNAVAQGQITGGSIQTGTYTFEATPFSGGNPLQVTFDLNSVPEAPATADLADPIGASPDNEIVLNGNRPVFSWNLANGAQKYRCRVDVFSGASWARVYDSGWQGETSHKAKMPLPMNVPLRWYVDAYNGNDWPSTTAMSRSVRQKFTIEEPLVTVGGVFGISTRPGREFAFSAAMGDTEILVGFQGDGLWQAQDPRSQIAGQLVATAGGLTGQVIEAGRTGGMPQVASDGDGYLMVWADDMSQGPDNLYGLFLDAFGEKQGAPFLIQEGIDDLGGLAYGGGKYLSVYYRDSGGGVMKAYGRFVSQDKAVENEITISTGSGSLAYNGVASDGNDFFVAWIDDINNYEVRGRKVTAGGGLGSEISVNASAGFSDNPLSVAFDGSRYLVVWMDEKGDGQRTGSWLLNGQFVTAAGALSGDPFALTTGGSQFAPLVAWDGSQYLVSWTNMANDADGDWLCDPGEGTCHDVWARLVSGQGELLGTAFPVFAGPGNELGGSMLSVGGKFFFLINSGVTVGAEEDGDIQGGNVLGLFVTPNQAPRDEEAALASDMLDFLLAYNSQDVTAAVAYLSDKVILDGFNKDIIHQFLAEDLTSPDFQPLDPADFSATFDVSGSTAQVFAQWADNFPPWADCQSDTMYWIKELDGTWRFYGNQEPFPLEVWSEHDDGYWINFHLEDMFGQITGVSVVGEGIDDVLNLYHNEEENRWGSWDQNYQRIGPHYPDNPPNAPLMYEVYIQTQERSWRIPAQVSGFVDVFATDLLPADGSSIDSLDSFSFTGAGPGWVYEIELYTSTWQHLWRKDDIQSSPVTYTGDPLADGNYRYNIHIEDCDGNTSTVSAFFTKGAPDNPARISGNVTTSATGTLTSLGGATITIMETGQTATTDANGDYTLTNLWPGTYTIYVHKPGFIDQYTHDVQVAEGQALAGQDFDDVPLLICDGIYSQQDMDNAIYNERIKWDVDRDNRKGLAEAIDALQTLTGNRPQP